MQQQTVSIAGMHCRSCELILTDAILDVPGVKKVHVDYKKGCAVVHYETQKPSEQSLAEAINNAGYSVGEAGPLPWVTKDKADWKYLLLSALMLVVLYNVLNAVGLLDVSLQDKEMTFGFALLLGLVAGLSTCMALVGGLVLGVSARHNEQHPEATPWQKFRPHLYFNGGRIVGYAVLGGLLGLLGGVFQVTGNLLGLITLAVGAVMIVLGIKLTNLSPRIAGSTIALPSAVAKLLGVSKHQKEYSHRASILSGALTFFLPCGFTQALQLYAISTGDFKSAALIMGAFALGTSPALLGIGGLSSVMKGARARLFYAFVGLLVMVFGVYNIQSALNVLPLPNFSSGTNQGSYPIVDPEGVDTSPTDVRADEVNAEGQQVVKMTQSGSGYRPSTMRVKAGVPVRWVITSTSTYTCASSIVVPSLNISRNLVKGENVIEFTPTQKGTIPFSCSMGMYRGSFIVE